VVAPQAKLQTSQPSPRLFFLLLFLCLWYPFCLRLNLLILFKIWLMGDSTP
jgi:hypothetical protein